MNDWIWTLLVVLGAMGLGLSLGAIIASIKDNGTDPPQHFLR